MSPRQLHVWHDQTLVATLTARRPWDLRCRYESAAFESGEANRPLLSCSLPVTRQRLDATPWVRGLLPEGAHLLALASRAGVTTNDVAGLLARYGRDIAGAFTISEGPPDERRWDVEPYSDAELADELRLVADAPGFAVRDDSELSIAGLQNKLLVVRLPDGGWARPRNGHPSSHLIKLADARHDGLLAAEHACLALARSVGLTTVDAELLDVDGLQVLAVERYDRSVDGRTGALRRLHQEDACQALGVDIDAHQGRGKYERFGGPSFAGVAALLLQHGDPDVAFAQLLRVAAFTAAIGNADAHGKNLSFLIDIDRGSIALAPLYDTVPTALWPSLRTDAAMSINGSSGHPTREDLVAEARSWGMAPARSETVLDSFTSDLLRAAAACRHEPVAHLVLDRLRRL